LGPLRRGIPGALVGVASAIASVGIAQASGENVSVVLSVLAIALVGLLAGAAAALWTYGVAGLMTVLLAVPPAGEQISGGDAFNVAAFVIGSPLVILVALRAERRQQETAVDRDESVVAEYEARVEQREADVARAALHDTMQLLERERTRLAEVAEAIPEPLIVYDGSGRGTYANRAALRVVGRSFYDQAVDDWARLVAPRDERGNAIGHDQWPQVRGRREAFQQRIVVRLPMSGRDLMVDVEGTPMPDGGCVLLLRDVGKEVDERRRLSSFASFVAHELRNPLAVAKARMELAGRERDRSHKVTQHEERALESVDAAIAILERLELFSRAEAGRLEATREWFDLASAVEAAVERLRAHGSDRQVLVECTGEPTVMGDRRLTEQAITNLLTNADRYSRSGGPIAISISSNGRTTLRISDDGPGIADDIAERLFRERVTSGRGLGLGLYLVHASMQAQGATVSIEQRRPRATFVLSWPQVVGDGPGAAEAAAE
jgi:signal transduction histidine kinase